MAASILNDNMRGGVVRMDNKGVVVDERKR